MLLCSVACAVIFVIILCVLRKLSRCILAFWSVHPNADAEDQTLKIRH